MSVWEQYPATYRASEVRAILRAVCAGECVAVVGLSGSGKSNLLGFIANRVGVMDQGGCDGGSLPRFLFVDCNRLVEPSPAAFFQLVQRNLGVEQFMGEAVSAPASALVALESALAQRMTETNGLCLLLDRFDALTEQPFFEVVASSLRALRDAYKYQLTYVVGTRRPLELHTELAELFFGHVLWLGPLSKEDALWSAQRDAQRFATRGRAWDREVSEKLVEAAWGYPSLLRAACEAYASGTEAEVEALGQHPAVVRRVEEFWADEPDEEALQQSRLLGHPLLTISTSTARASVQEALVDNSQLTAKEHLLLEFLRAHAGQVCEKDELVRAVWPEDVIYEQGVRDESLAQLVRRLRVKIEPDASNPIHIQTVPGRGYLFRL